MVLVPQTQSRLPQTQPPGARRRNASEPPQPADPPAPHLQDRHPSDPRFADRQAPGCSPGWLPCPSPASQGSWWSCLFAPLHQVLKYAQVPQRSRACQSMCDAPKTRGARVSLSMLSSAWRPKSRPSEDARRARRPSELWDDRHMVSPEAGELRGREAQPPRSSGAPPPASLTPSVPQLLSFSDQLLSSSAPQLLSSLQPLNPVEATVRFSASTGYSEASEQTC
mmetsp:Transcript_31694/g.49612  ORF Transcript_31694/g.49612 Transcript_31694/m.49612 type:complete len:224 (+) Transcript_31694:2267-2938(+)